MSYEDVYWDAPLAKINLSQVCYEATLKNISGDIVFVWDGLNG
jgi:hypothetical protein